MQGHLQRIEQLTEERRKIYTERYRIKQCAQNLHHNVAHLFIAKHYKKWTDIALQSFKFSCELNSE